MSRAEFSIVLELHQPVPAPGESIESSWGPASLATEWPLLGALVQLSEAGLADAVTLAVSPGWWAVASSPEARRGTALALEAAREQASDTEERARLDALSAFVGAHGSDASGLLRRLAVGSGLEVITSAASQAWLPSLVDEAIWGRAQILLAADEHARIVGTKPRGVWLPHLAYRSGMEWWAAEAGCDYMLVDAEAFRRGSVTPPADVYGPMITASGVAAVAPGGVVGAWPNSEAAAAGFVEDWARQVEQAPRDCEYPSLAILALSADELATNGSKWAEGLVHLVRVVDGRSGGEATTPGRALARRADGPLGNPGLSAGGWLSVRPDGSRHYDRARILAELLEDRVARESSADDGEALAALTRALLLATSLDWRRPATHPVGPGLGLERAEWFLNAAEQIGATLIAGLDTPGRLAALQPPVAYLPSLDVGRLRGD